MDSNKQPEQRPVVVCIHSSAGNGGQWRALRQALRGRCRLYTPDLVGYGSRRFRPGSKLTLQDEVDAILEQIGDITEPFHLIGHSYGGVVATYLAKHYPERVRSLVVYEPANFALLFEEGRQTPAAAEILQVQAAFANGATTTFSRWRAARKFITYWSGARAWQQIGFAKRKQFADLMPKVAAEFDALTNARLTRLEDLEMPVKLISGTRTRLAAKRVCQLMAAKVHNCRHLQLVDVAHMAPVTDPGSVNPVLVDHVLPVLTATAASANRRTA